MVDLLYQKINAVTDLSKDDFDYFKGLFVAKRLRKRQYLLQEGDVCKYQAFVERGLLRSYTVDEKGNEHILQFAVEDWWISDLASLATGQEAQLNVDALEVKAVRRATGLSQTKFAEVIDVQIGTLRNWEQGRRSPTGPAKALLKAIRNDPKHVLEALSG